MLSVDFLQLAPDAHHLAIVRYGVEGAKPRLCDMALVRCLPDAIEQFPTYYRQVPSSIEEQDAQRFPMAFTFKVGAGRDPSTWAASGLSVIEHHKHIALRWTRGNDNALFNKVTQQLLNHPLWLSTGEAWRLHQAVTAHQAARLPKRI